MTLEQLQAESEKKQAVRMDLYRKWHEFWEKESKYTSQTHLTADTIGIVIDFVSQQLEQVKTYEMGRKE